MEPFDYTGSPARIVFEPGARFKIAEILEQMGCKRGLLLSTPFQEDDVKALALKAGDAIVGVYANATMHTPVEVTEDAMSHVKALDADCVIAYGGGSTVGLAKAIAYRTGLPQIAVPTTYAGSEVTPILGQTENAVKTTLKDPKVLPGVVIYDPELTLTLPDSMTVNSALNAMAHAIEGLYAQDRNPISTLMSAEGIRALLTALPKIKESPQDLAARSDALYGAWLCGTVLGSVGMALHHKLCHTLGGTFNLPHAETHAVIIPHATAFNAKAVPELLQPIADVLGVSDPGQGLYDYAQKVGAPTSLADLGMPEEGIEKAADIAVSNPYWNPRSFDRNDILTLISNAWHGRPPSG